MKTHLTLLFITLLYLCKPSIGQTIKEKQCQNIYIYNNAKDTICFKATSLKHNPFSIFCNSLVIIDSIQIDGNGSKEFVFYRFCRFSNNSHGGSFDIEEQTEIGKYEIWNLDTKTLLFEAVHSLKTDYKRFLGGGPTSKGTEFYKYNLTIDSLGVIKIKYLNAKAYSLKPDKAEGFYKYVKGQYIKE